MSTRFAGLCLFLCCLFMSSTSTILTYATALSATSQVFYVDPVNGRDNKSGTSPDKPLQTIQKAISFARAGDTIQLAPGVYAQDVLFNEHSGSAQKPITLTGPKDAILIGDATNNNFRAVQVMQDYITIKGFTIDGLNGPSDVVTSYRKQLIYVQGRDEGTPTPTGVRGVRILNMTLRNSGQECVRLRARATNNEIAFNDIANCGICDFRFGCTANKNGEGIYIGTEPDQLVARGAVDDPSNNNSIHDNVFNTQASECVDLKEGTEGNIIEHNICTGAQDIKGGGISVQGSNNIVRDNDIFGHLGSGVRIAGDRVDDARNNRVEGNRIYQNRSGIAVQGDDNVIQKNVIYGHSLMGIRIAPDGPNAALNNTVQLNIIYANLGGGIEFEASPQGEVCNNTMLNNSGGNAIGALRASFAPDMPCGRIILSILVRRV